MRLFVTSLCLLVATTAAQASSDDAWAAFNSTVTEACAAASGLDDPKVSALVGFDDSLNKVAALVSGIYSQPHMNGASGTMLCIFDKQTEQTWIDEAAGWTAPDTE
ncbi:hypothetical protein [Devosia beringensis]|uniref:hypothetical protein n=1 Tax=Devosia beringensis TaxID=2657486 RepID=UPI00186B71A5|nr:hypothetical protein [Devosia beringensis]